jgi:hypothetical protein
MTYRVEDIIEYLNHHQDKYSFDIREYASPRGEYTNEAVIFSVVISELIGIIFDEMPVNPTQYYTKREMLILLGKLERKGKRIQKLLNKTSNNFKKHVR